MAIIESIVTHVFCLANLIHNIFVFARCEKESNGSFTLHWMSVKKKLKALLNQRDCEDLQHFL